MGTFIVIGMTGRKRHGKSTFATLLGERLVNSGFHVEYVNFKDPLLDVARFIGWNGKKDEKGRKLLQRLGTDVVRECIDQDYWVKKWADRVVSRRDTAVRNTVVIADDVRFDNEGEAVINEFGGIIVKVTTPELNDKTADTHSSEQGIRPTLVDYDYKLQYGMEHVQEAVDKFYRCEIDNIKEVH